MSNPSRTHPTRSETLDDVELLEELAIGMAQARIDRAMVQAGVSRADLARRMQCQPSFITKILTGEHNLTVRTLARALAALQQRVQIDATPLDHRWSATALPMTPSRYMGALAKAGAPSSLVMEIPCGSPA